MRRMNGPYQACDGFCGFKHSGLRYPFWNPRPRMDPHEPDVWTVKNSNKP